MTEPRLSLPFFILLLYRLFLILLVIGRSHLLDLGNNSPDRIGNGASRMLRTSSIRNVDGLMMTKINSLIQSDSQRQVRLFNATKLYRPGELLINSRKHGHRMGIRDQRCRRGQCLSHEHQETNM
jgi:hypothetical protein